MLFYAFCLQFGSILLNLGSILLPFWLHFESILAPSASPEGSRGQGREMCTKCIDFGVPRASHLECNFRSKSLQKINQIFAQFFNGFFIDFESQNSSQNLSKKPPKINQQICPKIHTFFHGFFIDSALIFEDIFKLFQ